MPRRTSPPRLLPALLQAAADDRRQVCPPATPPPQGASYPMRMKGHRARLGCRRQTSRADARTARPVDRRCGMSALPTSRSTSQMRLQDVSMESRHRGSLGRATHHTKQSFQDMPMFPPSHVPSVPDRDASLVAVALPFQAKGETACR